jgi:hypothetical protein
LTYIRLEISVADHLSVDVPQRIQHLTDPIDSNCFRHSFSFLADPVFQSSTFAAVVQQKGEEKQTNFNTYSLLFEISSTYKSSTITNSSGKSNFSNNFNT